MDLMYEKMMELNSKLDELQEVVSNLSEEIKILGCYPNHNHHQEVEAYSPFSEMIPPTVKNDEYADLNMEHKDILVGGNSWQYHSYKYKQMGISAEVEIRRLTAQLTAAYNRIAALEEQLLNRKNVESKVIR